MIEIYVDADACPVKDEVVRVADRYGLAAHFVANAPMRLPEGRDVRRVVVPGEPDAADDWIAGEIGVGDICVTADIPLASRCLERRALVLGPDGSEFTHDSIGMAMAMRDLNAHRRETGELGAGGGKPFTARSRSDFLQMLDQLVLRARKAKAASAVQR